MEADWVGGGIKAFINNVLKTNPINLKSGLGVRSALTKGLKTFGLYDFFAGLGFAGGKDGQIDKFPNLLNILNPLSSILYYSNLSLAKEMKVKLVLVVVRLRLLLIIKITRMVKMQKQWQQKQHMKVVRVMQSLFQFQFNRLNKLQLRTIEVELWDIEQLSLTTLKLLCMEVNKT